MLAIEWSSGIEDTWSSIATFIPKLLLAILILVIGKFIAGIFRKIAETVLSKIGFDNVMDKAGLGIHMERAGYPDSGKLLAKLAYYFIMLMVIQVAADTLDITAINNVIDDILAFIPKLFVALIIIVITGAAANFVRDAVSSGMAASNPGAAPQMGSAAAAAVWLIGGFAAINQLGIATDIVDTLFTAISASLVGILVIKYGVGGINSARDRFWPKAYDFFDGNNTQNPNAPR